VNYRRSLIADDVKMHRSWDSDVAGGNLPHTPSLPPIARPLQTDDKEITVYKAVLAATSTDRNPKATSIDPTHNLFKDGAVMFNKKAPFHARKALDDTSGVAILITVGPKPEAKTEMKDGILKRLFGKKPVTNSSNQHIAKIDDMCTLSRTELFVFHIPGLAGLDPDDWSEANIQRVHDTARRHLAAERTKVNMELLATELVGFRRVREERAHLSNEQRFPTPVTELPTHSNVPELHHDAITLAP
jgi:hypothetical protein